jgi:two-component system, LytTR family, sensor kinase
MNISKIILQKLRIVWHLLFWAGAFIVLLQMFHQAPGFEKIDVLYTLFFMLPILLAVYANLYILIPLLLRKQHLIGFILSCVALCFLSAGFIYLLFESWIDYILKNYYFISSLKMTDLMVYTSVFILITTLVKLSKEWFLLTRKEGELTKIQLRNLQAQINPHFLLNSLQTIYSLSLNKSEKTSDSILQLSEILKFTLYESEDERVKLSRELEVVRDYLEMYRLRLDPIRAKISLNISGETEDLKIIPMTFLPFVENSFKHGLQASEKKAYVDIDFQINEKKLNFTIENNVGDTDQIANSEPGGIGIKNTRNRLDIFYKNKYSLKVDETKETYRVTLTIDLA